MLDIVKYAAQRGVRVLPELDAPRVGGSGSKLPALCQQGAMAGMVHGTAM